MPPPCPLCASEVLPIVWQNRMCRVVWVQDPEYPGYLRVIWQRHVEEMTDLSWAEANHLWRILWGVERALRAEAQPDKVNLAAFGNVVPHLHWHVIPRYRDDPHFPEPYWGRRVRNRPSVRAVATCETMRAALTAELGRGEDVALV
ncbi:MULTISPECIES: HIT family protein [Hydrogenophilaceae]|uniref:HIT family protein n=1 Tax=Hydrogenophilus thermoluteolus TaxID=297 RepID=A0A2Z6E058_HYDTE|nr:MULTISPECIES: HIT family protein [Hydrogenophilaceae]BBD77960.1 HIT family protein [Hydrogenophilus thermoluteolus]HCO77539.1 HIT family protein [Rhodocyclaceae bacterium]HNQ49647.1 HIT family protein [Hydrogenophilus thermoluteolus]